MYENLSPFISIVQLFYSLPNISILFQRRVREKRGGGGGGHLFQQQLFFGKFPMKMGICELLQYFQQKNLNRSDLGPAAKGHNTLVIKKCHQNT